MPDVIIYTEGECSATYHEDGSYTMCFQEEGEDPVLVVVVPEVLPLLMPVASHSGMTRRKWRMPEQDDGG